MDIAIMTKRTTDDDADEGLQSLGTLLDFELRWAQH